MNQQIFDLCVALLQWLADKCGTDYVTVNVVLFCFVGPVVFLVLLIYALSQHARAEHYKLCWQLSMSIKHRE